MPLRYIVIYHGRMNSVALTHHLIVATSTASLARSPFVFTISHPVTEQTETLKASASHHIHSTPDPHPHPHRLLRLRPPPRLPMPPLLHMSPPRIQPRKRSPTTFLTTRNRYTVLARMHGLEVAIEVVVAFD